jgi:hypothetical protein
MDDPQSRSGTPRKGVTARLGAASPFLFSQRFPKYRYREAAVQ